MSLKKHFPLLIFCLFVLILSCFLNIPDHKLHVVFCDVGQGDAAYIRGPFGTDILIDGGPNERVLSCLGEHMPFWDRTIELIILSHPQADHAVGLIEVLKRYQALQIIDSSAKTDTQISKTWENLIKQKKIKNKITAEKGQRIIVDGNLLFEILWPEKNFTASNANEFSTVVRLTYGNFSCLFAGDISAETMNILSSSSFHNHPNLSNLPNSITVLKVPHHGAKNSLSKSFYEILSPKLAVISVGKNSYDHPSPKLLKLLNSLNIKTLRTDQSGTIEITTDGSSWTFPKSP